MRTSINLDDEIAALAEKMAQRENRNFSNLCEVALAEYCGARGLIAEETGDKSDDKFWAKAKRVAKKNPAFKEHIEEQLPKFTRRQFVGA